MALFEERDVVQAVRAVERDRLQEPGEHTRAQHRLLGAERIRRRARGDRRGAPARSRAAGETSDSVIASEQPNPDERVGHRAAIALERREPTDLARGLRHRPPDVVEPDAASDLLDEVDLAFQVGAERGNGGHQRVAVAHRRIGLVEVDAQRRQRVPHFFGVERRCRARG